MSCPGSAFGVIVMLIIWWVVKSVIKSVNAEGESKSSPSGPTFEPQTRTRQAHAQSSQPASYAPAQSPTPANSPSATEAPPPRRASIGSAPPQPEPVAPPPVEPPPTTGPATAPVWSERSDGGGAGADKEAGSVQTLIESILSTGGMGARVEQEIANDWRGKTLSGTGRVLSSQEVFGVDVDFHRTKGSKVAVEVGGVEGGLPPKALVHVPDGDVAAGLAAGDEVRFTGVVKEYRSVLRTLLLEEGTVESAG